MCEVIQFDDKDISDGNFDIDYDGDFEFYPHCDIYTSKVHIVGYENGIPYSQRMSLQEAIKVARKYKCRILTKNGVNGKWYIKAPNVEYSKVKKKLDNIIKEGKNTYTRNFCYLLTYDSDKPYITNEEQLEDGDGFLYFVKVNSDKPEYNDLVKIGRSVNPRKRLQSAFTWMRPFANLYVFKQIKCRDYVGAETTMHRYLQDRRYTINESSTEWFLLNIQEIDNICAELINKN